MAGKTTVWAAIPLEALTEEETPITYGVVKPGEEGDVPFVRGGDIAGGRVLTDQLRTIGRDTSQQYRRTLLRGGEILVSLVGNPGQIAIAPPSLAGANIARQVGLVRLKPEVDTRFVSYFLQSHDGQTALGAQSLGSVQQVINLRDLKTVKVPLPPLHEQRAIASVLGSLDDKIDLNRRMCQTLEEMARALFKSWFVDFDPVRAKVEGRDPGLPKEIADLFPSRLVDSELGPIPEGWTAGHVGELAALNPESWTAKSRPRAVRYLDLASAKWGRFDEAQRLAGDAIPSRAQRVLKPGDSVVGTVRPGNGSFGLIYDDELTGSTGFAVLRPAATRNRVYVYLSVTAAENIDRLSRLADGGAYPAVRPDVVSATPCVHPPARLLEQVELVAGSWLDRVAACESESRSLAALRDTLLPKLISGEVRVPASLGSMQKLSG
jgi:type I restriction enzyme S subunit